MALAKSLFRVKYYAAMVAAFTLFLFYKSELRPHTPEMQFLLITLPFMAVSLFAALIKCESCGSRVLDINAGLSKKNVEKVYNLRTYFPPKHCPECGYERY